MSKKSSNQVKLYKRSEDPAISKAGRLYNLRRESRLCVKCGGQLDESSNLLCTSHLDYYNNWHASKRAKIKAALELLEASKQPEVVQTTEVVKTKARKSSKQAK